MRKFGLIGRNISYSFSRNYFKEKFNREGLSASYENFDLQELSYFPKVLETNPDLQGLNVTIPYKEKIISLLDELDTEASEIGAVNTIKFNPSGTLTGYNTDHYGFKQALFPHLSHHHQKALVLGTGGASKAVAYALHSLGIEFCFVSRNPGQNTLSYGQLDQQHIADNPIIVNCTPLGTFPNTQQYPPIPVGAFSKNHLVFDLIYNPAKTRLMELAAAQGATVRNGQKMLEYQAEKSWELWNQ